MRFFPACLCLFALCAFALAGCKAEDEIRTDIVKHEDREPLRLRVAIMNRGDDAWFFRISGPEKLVTEHEKAFEEFVKSAKFSDNKKNPLTVTEPKEWKKDPPGGAMRYAGYRIAAKPKEIEVTINKLPGGKDFDLLHNVQRWQKQIHLPPTDRVDDLGPEMRKEKHEGQEIIWISLDNGMGVHTVSTPPIPVAANSKKIGGLIDIRKKPPAGGDFPFKFTVPAEWKRKPARQFVLDVYEIQDGDKVFEVTLSTAGGTLGSNIARWHTDILKLERIDEREAVRLAQAPKKIAGTNMFFVDLQILRHKEPDKNRILGVIIPAGQGNNWFVKMTGPIDAVGRHKKAFETFVEGFQLDAP